MSKHLVPLLCIALVLTSTVTASAVHQEARTCVARLDGAPVYHWRAFTSSLPDDVDRALVLREFHRRGFKLPPKLVDDALHREVIEHYAGDEKQFVGSLEHKGVTMADYRQFTAEEITISAMLYQRPSQHAQSTQAEWLATLRKAAHVELLAASTPKS